MTDTLEPDVIYSISELNHEVGALLKGQLPMIWVEGEISNLARPASGHIYFSLKDSGAQARCAMFRMKARALPFSPENGTQVLARVRVGLYEPRGDFQLVVETMEESGDGALRREFEHLKKKLDAAGLFSVEHKNPLPKLPKRVGIITSSSGAAVHDIISVLGRRFPGLPILIYPTLVQGEASANEIAATIALADARQDCDILIVGRGGGSLEDLWAFNEEVVAQAIFDCSIPIVSSVGHEVDVTIADFVADVRAPTPSAAAELITPDQDEWMQRFDQFANRIALRANSALTQTRTALTGLSRRLEQQHPQKILEAGRQRLNELQPRLQKTWGRQRNEKRSALSNVHTRLQAASPEKRLPQLKTHRDQLDQRLRRTMEQTLVSQRQQFTALMRTLDTVSPLATLGRGYAIVQKEDMNTVVKNSDDVSIGETIHAKLGKGQIRCTVKETIDV